MNNAELFELMQQFEKSGCARLKLSREGFELELEKPAPAPIIMGAPMAASAAPMAQPTALPAAPIEEAPPTGDFVTAPLVGTFYRAPSPDAAPFVTPGDRVEQGQTLCLIEAMKTINEVVAPKACIVEEILAENGALVSFGQHLLRYRSV